MNNQGEWAKRLWELSMGAKGDLDEAIELLRYSSKDRTLYRVFREEGLFLSFNYFASVFEHMAPVEAAQYLIEVAQNEFKSGKDKGKDMSFG